jgi:hypothetical protein
MSRKNNLARDEQKLSIIKILLEVGDSTQKALSEAIGVSRATIASLCEELIDKKLVFRRNERCYALDPAKDFLILKIYPDVAELVSCDFLGGCTRREIQYATSMTPEENAARVIGIIEKHMDRQRPAGAAVLCDLEQAISAPKSFDLSLLRPELVASAIDGLYPDKAVLYVDPLRELSLLCFGGNVVGKGKIARKGMDAVLGAFFDVAKPDRVLLDLSGYAKDAFAELFAIRTFCEKAGVALDAARSDELTPDENETVMRLIAKTI